MTAPITPDERAAMRETIATLDAAWEADDPTRPLVTEHATLTLLAHVASAVPRLLDALEEAEAALVELAPARDERIIARLRDAHDLIRSLPYTGTDVREAVAALVEAIADPAPVWDEDTVTEDVARAMFPNYFTDDRQPLRVFTETRSDAELREAEREAARHRARQALAVVRRHLPVRPDREMVALTLCREQRSTEHMEQTDDAPCSRCLVWADAVLALFEGGADRG